MSDIVNRQTMTALAESLTSFAFDKVYGEFADQESALFMRVRNAIAPDFDERIKNLPQEWFTSSSLVDVVIGPGLRGRIGNFYARESEAWIERCAKASENGRFPSMYHIASSCGGIAALRRSVRMPGNIGQMYNDYIVVADYDAVLAADIQQHMLNLNKQSELARDFYTEALSLITSLKKRSRIVVEIPEIAKAAPWFEATVSPKNALVPNIKGFLCKLSSIRGEERDGCGKSEAPEIVAA